VAERLTEIAALLEQQGANPFRVRAYGAAADVLRSLKTPIAELLRSEGLPALTRLPGVGESLARTIEQLSTTGSVGLLERLRGGDDGERILTTVGGIGPKLAKRIHEQLAIETLEDFEIAAYDGRLEALPGMGVKRIRAIRESLAGRFRRRPKVPESAPQAISQDQPSVEELLGVDEEYRVRAEAGRLPRIAPRRFNPTREAWLPVLHTARGPRHYTALYSNTARAHELGTVRDWVVIYRDDHGGHGRWTVITARLGNLQGKRIVRGRENECVGYYDQPQRSKPLVDDGTAPPPRKLTPKK
jgi:DNA polymerase (family 10)